jgi:pSer/pThr/pTyr-binding forkhead associated (FHA) protein
MASTGPKDSFLQMIGLADADPEVSGLKPIDSDSQEESDEEFSLSSDESFIEETQQENQSFLERTELERISNAVATEDTTQPDFEEPNEVSRIEPQELYEYSDEQAEIMNSQTHRNGEFQVKEEEDSIDENSRTGIMTQEDRFLEGLEDAEYSRATDIFTSKTNSDDPRRTQAILGALEELDQPEIAPELDEVLAEASQPTKSLVYEEEVHGAISSVSNYETLVGEEIGNEDSARQTMAFNYLKETENYGRLFVREGIAQLDELVLQEFPVRLGRDPSNDLILDDVNSSRFHCEIQDRGGRVWIQDLGSTNGIKVNGAVIRGKEIRSKDIIQIGDIIIEYLGPGAQSDEAQTVKGAVAEVSSTMRISKLPLSYFKKNKRQVLAASAFILMGVVYAITQFGIPNLKEASTEIVAQSLREEVATLSAFAQSQTEGSIYNLNPEEVKAQAISQAKQNPLLSRFMSQLENVPADYFLLFVADPDLIEPFVATGGDMEVLLAGLRAQINRTIQSDDQTGTTKLLALWKAIQPNDPQIVEVEKKFKSQQSFVQTPELQSVSDEERELFLNFMKEYKANYDQLIADEQFSTAMVLSEDVIDRILKVVRQYPYYADFAEPYIADWKSKVAESQNLHAGVREERDRFRETLSEGRLVLREAQNLMDEGKIREANLRIEEFLASYTDHPDRPIALDYRNQIRDVIQQTYSAMKREVESFVQTENYELAWEKLYFFMDQVPNFEKTQEVKEILQAATYNRSRQFYNQARVFEFEADDLLSAEQYYKRTLETADPRGELAARANRRYQEVLRKKVQ